MFEREREREGGREGGRGRERERERERERGREGRGGREREREGTWIVASDPLIGSFVSFLTCGDS